MLPRQTAVLTFDKPGNYLYHCKEHPWSYGLLIVTDRQRSANANAGAGECAPAAQGRRKPALLRRRPAAKKPISSSAARATRPI